MKTTQYNTRQIEATQCHDKQMKTTHHYDKQIEIKGKQMEAKSSVDVVQVNYHQTRGVR